MSANVDLRQLAVRRNGAPPPAARRRRRHWLSRYVLPGAVLLGFAGVVGWAARDSFLPSRSVTVVPVFTSTAAVQQEGTPLFQAAGWVEPRPTPTVVSALAEGVVDQLLVVEGQEVRAGEPVARLIDAEARLALRDAEAQARMRRADVASAQAALVAARTNLEKPTQLAAAVAEAEAMLAQKQTELASLPFQLRSAQARVRSVQATYDGQRQLQASRLTPEIQLIQSRSEVETATATVEEIQARLTRLGREVEAQTARRDALRQRLDLKTDEKRQQTDADAQLEAAAARLQLAEVAVDTARLRLDRMTVRAPSAGRVLALVARPGTRLMGLAGGTLQDASTVVTLYDPARLQVRADVRLEDVPRAVPGQPVRIETPAAPGGPLSGEVLFLTAITDIQKNTLQVKVALTKPPPTVRPDMLVQATFLAPASTAPAEPGPATLRLLVPRALVDAGDGGPGVWVADQAAGVARRRPVKIGPAAGDWVEVAEGLTVADRLIAGGRDGLRDGDRIRVTGEEAPPAAAGSPAHGTPSRLPPPAGDHKAGN